MQSQDYDQSFRRSRSRSRSGSRSVRGRYQLAGGARVAVAVRRVPRSLRPNSVKDFSFTYQPFNLTITHGAGGGINFYNQGSVPTAPVTVAGGNTFQFNFSLSQMETLINGGGAGAIAFAQHLNYTEYTALFDAYRIRKVQLQMVYNADSQSQTMVTGLPNIMMANDYDDSLATTTASLTQYPSFKLIQMGSGADNCKYWTVKPKTQISVETTTGAVTSISGKEFDWIDCATPNAKYFGVKGIVDTQVTGGALANVGYITFYVKVWVQFKNTR